MIVITARTRVRAQTAIIEVKNSLPMPKSFPKVRKTIGDYLRARRISLGLSQEEVANQLGVCVDSITNWENNRAVPQIHLLPRIFTFLEEVPVPIDQSSYAGKVKGLRLLLGLDRKGFASLMKVDESTVRYWEWGKNLPVIKRRKQIDALLEKYLKKVKFAISSWNSG
ncbi:MAG: XRE family transcriptional regulator [Flavobacterium sp.]|nr:MAG: XRE family transcriptional regulator [Flavobacterium sp.]